MSIQEVLATADWVGEIVSAEFVREGDECCSEHDAGDCCGCCTYDGPRPQGTYITVRIDDPLAPVFASRVALITMPDAEAQS